MPWKPAQHAVLYLQRRNAEDYFRLGTRIQPLQIKAAKPTILHRLPIGRPSRGDSSDSGYQSNRNPFRAAQDIALPEAAVVANGNRSQEMHVIPQVRLSEKASKQPSKANQQSMPALRYTRAMHHDFPLHKFERLRRVRVELAGFSILIVLGLANFLAWCCKRIVPSFSKTRLQTINSTASLLRRVLWVSAHLE